MDASITLVNHPQVAFRKTFVNANYANGIHYSVPGNPLLVSGMEREMEYPTAKLGEHTFEILGEVCDAKTLHEIMDPVQKKAEDKAAELYAKS